MIGLRGIFVRLEFRVHLFKFVGSSRAPEGWGVMAFGADWTNWFFGTSVGDVPRRVSEFVSADDLLVLIERGDLKRVG